MAIDKTVYIHVNEQKNGYQIQTNQTLSKFDKFRFVEPSPANSYSVVDKILDAILYLHNDSPRQVGLFEVSGNKEVVSMLTDLEFVKGLHPTLYSHKQVLARLEAMFKIKDLIIVAK